MRECQSIMKPSFLLSARQQPVSHYFDARTESAPETHNFEADAKADVIVVGAGFTGLSAALTLAEAGVDVRVLDARHIGWGGSGRAWGQVAASAKFMPAQIETDFPSDVAERINQAAAHAPDLVFGLVEKHGMTCDVVRTGNLIAAHIPSKEAGLARTVEDLVRRGYPVELLEGDDCRTVTGSPRYRVALHDRRGGSLNPLGYARGLARAAIGAGALIHEKTAVLGLRRDKSGWVAKTNGGEIRADAVLLATNAFTSNALFPAIGREVFPVRAYQIVSEPLNKTQLATVLPGRQSLNDTRKLYSGIRIWPDGRLQIGIDGPPFAMDGKAYVRSAIRRIEMTYPQLKGLKWGESWGGWVDMTVDEYPKLHALAPGLWSGYGFSGRGIAIGTIMGRDLAAHALSRPEEAVHPISPLQPKIWHAFHRPLVSALINWNRAHDRVSDLFYSKLGENAGLNKGR
ncbi:NAD(P)/FAD-dependent oxidoreductase [Brucella gallinifaecis]|uniref:FAD-binding oxidoreductase n=1 Tax=Brucella gallinifaecis TaxID=215590 RepID=A0A502BKU5_9HYPH|nr:FAD-dependent oxidoreductase [Brucella gallinifaecis]TPF74289.1 FAD-binding oxidoreductase [Brucella gallinifaecis]